MEKDGASTGEPGKRGGGDAAGDAAGVGPESPIFWQHNCRFLKVLCGYQKQPDFTVGNRRLWPFHLL